MNVYIVAQILPLLRVVVKNKPIKYDNYDIHITSSHQISTPTTKTKIGIYTT